MTINFRQIGRGEQELGGDPFLVLLILCTHLQLCSLCVLFYEMPAMQAVERRETLYCECLAWLHWGLNSADVQRITVIAQCVGLSQLARLKSVMYNTV